MKSDRISTRAGRPQRTPSSGRPVDDEPDRRRRTAVGTSRTSAQRSGRPAEGRRENRRETRRDARRPHEPGSVRRGPQTAPVPRPVEVPGRAKSANQAKARAKARKAKAPKVIRPPMWERLRTRLQERVIARFVALDLRPQALLARVPFVVLVIGALGIGLGFTLWLSTASAGRSYEIGGARALNEALLQQKESLERDVLQAESAPALAEAARDLGMIPSKGTAHLVQDPAGNWVVIGQPKPAEGVPPPPLNSKLPDPKPPAPAVPPPPAPLPVGAEVPTRVAGAGIPGSPGTAPGAEVPVRLPVSGGLPATPAVAPGSALPAPALPGLPAVAPLAGDGVSGAPGLSLPPVSVGPAPVGLAPAASGTPAYPISPSAGSNGVIPALEPNGVIPPPAPDGFLPQSGASPVPALGPGVGQ